MSSSSGTRHLVAWAVAAALGLLGCALGFALEPKAFAFSYLAAYLTVLTTVLGALWLMLIGHAVRATWVVVLRPWLERVAATLPALAVLFVPIVALAPKLYATSMSVVGLAVRAVVYFAVWSGVALALRRASRREAHAQQRAIAAGAMPFVAFTMTFAAFDWAMALEPEFHSTIYGVYLFAGAMVGGLAVLALHVAAAVRRPDNDGITVSHLFTVGKLLLTFVAFWAYIAFSQFLLVWIANLPDEAGYYVVRATGAWTVVSAFDAGGHALALLLLLSWSLKRSARAVTLVGIGLLALHYVDVYALVLPALDPGGAQPRWTDAAALLFVTAAVVAWSKGLARAPAAAPRGDPDYLLSLHYEDA